MSYSVILGGEDWTEVASIAGWKEFREWTETLDGEFGELSHFVEYGWSQNLDALNAQLTEAIETGNPSADVTDIATTIQTAINSKPEGAVSIQLTDGLTANESGDGWQSKEEPDDDEA